jgi:hypothetical protein
MACALTAAVSNGAAGGEAKRCTDTWPEPFSFGQSFILNDPRSETTLYLESDGRHMRATTREGTIVWRRNLFGDPKIERLFPPPPAFPGQPDVSPEKWRGKMHAYVSQLRIDRIGIEPDCMVRFIDHELPSVFKGHYVRAGSGTHIFWLLNAKTGDFKMEQIN